MSSGATSTSPRVAGVGPTSPGSVHRSASSTIRSLYDGLNRRRVGLSTTSGSGAAAALRLPSQVPGGDYHSLPFSLAVSASSFSLPSPYSNSFACSVSHVRWQRGDWQQSRIGANPPEVLVNLRKESTLSIMSACQVPISLITDADGTSQREAWRRFVMGSVEPLSQRMAEELSRQA